ncbi:MAG: hypothetical protein WAV25_01780 [Minisyncoccia bacterium]
MKKFLLISLAAAPALAFGASTSGFDSFLSSVKGTVDKLIPFLVGLALLGFFWGLVKFIFNSNNDEGREEAKSMMIYAIIALFVMTAVWGLVGFLGTAIGVDQGGSVTLPRTPSL